MDRSRLDQSPGWMTVDFLDNEMMLDLKQLVLESFRNNCLFTDLERNEAEGLEFVDLCNYHKTRISSNHSSLWPKQSRLLSKQSVDWLLDKSSPLIADLFPSFIVTDEEVLGYGNMYWRLVRPNQPSDVGPMHRDCWFWNIPGHTKLPEGYEKRYKFWLPLLVTEDLNTLQVISGSHLENSNDFDLVDRNGSLKPYSDTTHARKGDLEFTGVKDGQALVFHDSLLHQGCMNTAEKTRLSLEFTIAVAH